MPDKYEQYMMKQKLKEARHQSKMQVLRRKKEIAEIKDIKAKSRAREQEASTKTIFSIVFWFVAIGIICYLFSR